METVPTEKYNEQSAIFAKLNYVFSAQHQPLSSPLVCGRDVCVRFPGIYIGIRPSQSLKENKINESYYV